MRQMLLVMALALLSGCSHPEAPRHVIDTVEVKVPVLERAQAPKELIRTKIPAAEIPRFIAPNNPAATVCVTKAGEPLLKSIILRDESLLDGWENYAR